MNVQGTLVKPIVWEDVEKALRQVEEKVGLDEANLLRALIDGSGYTEIRKWDGDAGSDSGTTVRGRE